MIDGVTRMSVDIPNNTWHEKKHMTENQFMRLSEYVTENYGIKLPIAKKIMVEGRLQKRLKANGMASFDQYLEYVFSDVGHNELVEMIDAISTNKTDFFREATHFDYLQQSILPAYANKSVKIWSAASSSGEEIYTIAIAIEEYNRLNPQSKVNYSILGTDINVDILKHAIKGVYKHDRINDVPYEIRSRYFLRGKKPNFDLVRVVPHLRSKASFKRLNLMDNDYNVDHDFDIIFCRNVLIYFDKETQEKVINKLCSKLKTDGFFFLGHSESILGKNVPLKQLEPTIYKRL